MTIGIPFSNAICSRATLQPLELRHSNLLKSISVQCGHCNRWTPCKVIFWYFDAFRRWRDLGRVNRCPSCGNASAANEQKYRAFFENGQLVEKY